MIALLLFDGTLLCGDVRVTLPGNTHSVAGAPMVKLVDASDLKSVLSSPFCFRHQAGRSIVARTWEHPRRSFAARLDGQEPTRSQQGEV